MMISAACGSLTRCAECCSMRQRCVGRVVRSTGGVRKKGSRWERVSFKCGICLQGLRPESSSGRHDLEGFVAALSCTRAAKRQPNTMRAVKVMLTALVHLSIMRRDVSVKCWGKKVRMKLRVDYQIAFGEHMALLGSSECAGSWHSRVMMQWTQAGWVVDLEAGPGERIEYKYVIVKWNGNLVWEYGANRVLIVPDDSSKYYQVVSNWNATSETIDFKVIDVFQAPKGGATRVGQETANKAHDYEVIDVFRAPKGGATRLGQEMTSKAHDYEIIDGTQSPGDGAAEARKEVTDESVDCEVVDGYQFQEDGAAETKTEVTNEKVDFEIFYGTISPEDGAAKPGKEVTNDTIYSKFTQGSRAPEGPVIEVEQEKLKEDGNASSNLEKSEGPDKKNAVIQGEEVSSVRSIEDSRRRVGKRDAKGKDDSCKPVVEDDQSSASGWGKAAIFTLLMIDRYSTLLKDGPEDLVATEATLVLVTKTEK